MVLHGFETSPAMIAGAELHIVKLIAIHGRCPQGPHLTGPYQLIQGFHRFLDRRFIVEAVDDVEVEIVRPQPLQTAVNLAKDRLAGQAAVVEIDL